MPRVKKDVTSMRGALDFLDSKGLLLRVDKPVDINLEIAGILKALDGGPAILFENIKGFPGVRNVGDVVSNEDAVSAMFGVANKKELRFKCLDAMKHPLPPRKVKEAPCQEVVITKGIDIMGTMPVIQHSAYDVGRIIGGGIIPTMEPLMPKGSNLAFKRIRPQGKNWCSIYILRASHLGNTVYNVHKGEKIPFTINVGISPACVLVAATVFLHNIVPYESDEIGMAGALQDTPVEVAKAVTVDAPVIANAEWVIEGYLTPEKVWESEEAEKAGVTRGAAPFFPEWTGYLGKASIGFKFQATAITHRKDRPIFYTPLAHSIECEVAADPFKEACFYEMAQNLWPGLVKDTNILYGLKSSGGIVFQVGKRSRADEAAVKNILMDALMTSLVRVAIAVDEDVDIHNADDVFWAIATRANFENGIIKAPAGALGMSMFPAADASRAKGGAFEIGGLAIDATMSIAAKELFVRAHYPSDQIDLGKWFTDAQIAKVRAIQSDYAKLLARCGG
ncbi:MAG: UbiD family decarboxylase [Chloroflexota bacterium]